GTGRQARAGAHHGGQAAHGPGPREVAGDRGGGSAALRGNPCRAHGRNRPRRSGQTREQGQAEPASQPGFQATLMTGYAHPESLVATDWLAANLDAPDLRVVDATY